MKLVKQISFFFQKGNNSIDESFSMQTNIHVKCLYSNISFVAQIHFSNQIYKIRKLILKPKHTLGRMSFFFRAIWHTIGDLTKLGLKFVVSNIPCHN